MTEVVCVDGSVLCLTPVPCVGRDGVAYEVTLRIERDGQGIGHVGQRCGFFLATAAERVRAARAAGGPAALPDGDGRDGELLSLRARDPDDVSGAGELRIWVRDERTWAAGDDGEHGRWVHERRAVLDVWGSAGTGLRAELDSEGLLTLLDALVGDGRAMGAL